MILTPASLRARFLSPTALHANANALIVGTAVTSVAGLAFWALATRWLPAEAVGLGTALVSAVTLLANFATLGLRNGLVRFLPSAGASTGRLIVGSQLACVLAAVAFSGVFLVGQPWWAAQLGFLRADGVAIGAFVGATVVWVLFVLQDHVLIGLRRSVWVPVKSLAYSVGKLGVLPLLLFAPTWAVLGATMLPALAAVAVVGLLLARLSRSSRAPSGARARISVRRLVGFAAADQVAWLVWVATPHVLTLIVLHLRGPQASAYYYIANMIGYSLYLVTSNIGSALIAESVHDPARAASQARAALVHSASLVVPLALAGVLLGPFALGILGADYAQHATTAMQLIILSAIPQMIVGISVNTARVRREMSTVVVTYVFLAVTIWGGSWFTLQWWGLTGVGVTILVAQSAAAFILVLAGRTGLASTHETARAAWAVMALLPRSLRSRQVARERRRLLRPALEACGLPDAPVTREMKTDSDTIVTAVDAGSVELVVKLSTSPSCDRCLSRHAERVIALRDRDDRGYRELIPRILDLATVGQRTVVVETLLPGSVPDGVSDAESAAAIAAVARLHSGTARTMVVTPALLEEWIDAPSAHLRGRNRGAGYAGEIDRMVAFLHGGLIGRTITVGCTHGDFWPGNVLMTDTPSGPDVTGIVDWENGTDIGLPDFDHVHWYLATRPAELGTAVCRVLDEPERLDRYLTSVGSPRPNPHLDPEVLVVFAWLWHVANTGMRSTRQGPRRVWFARNVLPVVRRFGSDTPLVPGDPRVRHT